MDGAITAGARAGEHSDSDSESWTLLDDNTSYAQAHDVTNPAVERKPDGEASDGTDKDDDTDGISIISDSESESIAPCEHNQNINEPHSGHRPTEQPTSPNNLDDTHIAYNQNHDEDTRCEDILGDSNAKLKTYVHRRNKRLGTVLNVILLGSVITAAGVALGHMWGLQDDCQLQTPPNVNKILSDLVKLQEENEYLRNRLKELTEIRRQPVKPHRCRKVFEEPMHNLNVVKVTKCLDLEIDMPKPVRYTNTDLPIPHVPGIESSVDRKEFKNDVNKLKKIYKENKVWLDAEIDQRLKNEESVWIKTNKRNKPKEAYYEKGEGYTVQIKPPDQIKPEYAEEIIVGSKPEERKLKNVGKMVSYADSLKTVNKISTEEHKIEKRRAIDLKNSRPEKKRKMIPEKAFDLSDNEEDFPKDNRYSSHKLKYDRNKHDRRQHYKKQKRDNKYEQWEMKGGYMKDYDTVSTSSNENLNEPIGSHDKNKIDEPNRNYDKNYRSQEWERFNYMDQFSDIESVSDKVTNHPSDCKKLKGEKNTKQSLHVSQNAKNKDNISRDDGTSDWFEKRNAQRRQARARLAAEIGNGTNVKSSARWYFRRMSEREQCRARESNNSTKRKNPKRDMNFKTKR